MVIERQLETLGYEHINAEDGIEGFRLWQAEPVSLVLTDLHMPNLDGYATGWHKKSARRKRPWASQQSRSSP